MASSSSSPPSAKAKAKASTAPASTTTAPAAPPPPPSPAKAGFLRRVLPFLLAANLAVGVYVLVRTSFKKSEEEEEAKEVPAAPVATVETTIPEKKVVEPVTPPVKVLPPISEQEQRQIFQWILEEKRKVKPADRAEKKKIDEEKALLKEFIRAKSIPSL